MEFVQFMIKVFLMKKQKKLKLVQVLLLMKNIANYMLIILLYQIEKTLDNLNILKIFKKDQYYLLNNMPRLMVKINMFYKVLNNSIFVEN